MKSTFNLLSMCVIVMLLLSNAAFGVILSSGYSCGGDCSGNAVYDAGEEDSAAAASSDSSHTASWAAAGGIDGYYTTVDATCSWSAFLYVYAIASVTVANGSPEAEASADADAAMPYNWRSFSRSVSVYDYTGVTDEDYGSLSVGDTGTFYAGTGINCSHSVYTNTKASAYGSNQATAGAMATAGASMW